MSVPLYRDVCGSMRMPREQSLLLASMSLALGMLSECTSCRYVMSSFFWVAI